MTIYPTIFTNTKNELDRQLKLAQNHFNHVQIDIADGILVEGSSLSLIEALSVMRSYPELTYDMHLMVKDYADALATLDAHPDIHVRYALVHASAHPNPELFTPDTHRYAVGIVINPGEKLETISHIYPLKKLAAIQIMTVIPGAQGRPFEKDSLTYIDQLAAMHYTGEILIDGAVNETTVDMIAGRTHRPTIIGPGSYFSKATTPEEYAQKLHALETRIAQSAS